MESRTRTSQVADPRTSLAMWLRAGRAERQLTLEDVARVTKIQPRILEKIEAGQLEGLPAEVFVRGFVKSFARCVGLDESEAAARYGQCANAPATPTSSIARAFVETLVAAPKSEPKVAPVSPSVLVEPEIFPEASLAMTAMAGTTTMSDSFEIEVEDLAVDPAPAVAAVRGIEVVEIPAIEVIEIQDSRETSATDELPAGGKKKRTRKKPAGTSPPRNRKKKAPVGDVVHEMSCSVAEPACADLISAEPAAPLDRGELELAVGSEPVVAAPWKPTMPTMPTMPTVPTMPTMSTIAASVPWKRPAYPITRATKNNAFALPTLVIDDADPDLAELERDGRERAIKPGPHRVSFLPPILLDRDDKSSRQGGLTLAVILLLIAATLTLSYLMRRPSVSGDGMTQNSSIVDTTTVVA